jgi:hypothetical protein
MAFSFLAELLNVQPDKKPGSILKLRDRIS